ncbi:MAG: ABC transporter substrate-binding protein [Bacteroidales bacterium]|nr:ABC transporter substrate-binding protein [Bacteroidales bacterium]
MPNPSIVSLFRRTAAVAAALCFAVVLRGQDASPKEEGGRQYSFYTFWTPQSQYAGYILAEQDGIYRDCGLDLKVLHYDGTPSVKMLSDGKADFVSLTLLDALEARNNGLKLVNVFQLLAGSSFVVVSRKGPISTLEDLKGKEIVTYRAFNPTLKKEITRRLDGDVSIIEVYSCVEVFLCGAYDYLICTSYNELFEIEESGFDITRGNVLRLGDTGLDIAEDGVYALESFIKANPDAVDKFAEASALGWKAAEADIEHSLDVTLHRMEINHIVRNRYHERKMLKEMIRLEGEGSDFRLSREQYEKAASLVGEDRTVKVPYKTMVR